MVSIQLTQENIQELAEMFEMQTSDMLKLYISSPDEAGYAEDVSLVLKTLFDKVTFDVHPGMPFFFRDVALVEEYECDVIMFDNISDEYLQLLSQLVTNNPEFVNGVLSPENIDKLQMKILLTM